MLHGQWFLKFGKITKFTCYLCSVQNEHKPSSTRCTSAVWGLRRSLGYLQITIRKFSPVMRAQKGNWINWYISTSQKPKTLFPSVSSAVLLWGWEEQLIAGWLSHLCFTTRTHCRYSHVCSWSQSTLGAESLHVASRCLFSPCNVHMGVLWCSWVLHAASERVNKSMHVWLLMYMCSV